MVLRRLGVHLLVISALLAGAAGAASAATKKAMWGPTTLPNGASAFPTYKALGVDILEEQLNWARVARSRPARPTDPDDPAYAWPAGLDAAVDQAKASGIAVSLMVKETPAWANGNKTVATAPTKDADYTAFLIAATKRYPSVHHWMIWGEPTRAGNFAPMPENRPTGPRRYAKLLDASYVALKRASTRNIVIGGNTWTVGNVDPQHFVRWLRLPSGKPPRMDLWGHNPYSTRFPDIKKKPYVRGIRDISDLDTLHAEIAAAYKGRKVPKFFISEFAVASDRASRAFSFFVSRSEQARWVTAAFKLARSTGYVDTLGWYELLDQDAPAPDGLTNGLLTASGAAKPAFAAFKSAP